MGNLLINLLKNKHDTMVEAATTQRKKLGRFTPWVNRLEMPDSEVVKVTDIRKNVTKVEFRDT